MTEYHEEPGVSCTVITPPPPPAGAGEPSTPRALRLGDLLAEWEADATAAHLALTTGQARGPVSPFPSLTCAMGGAFWPGLHIMHGQPGAGKTAFALQVAASCGCPCLFISCEMAALELMRRITARLTGIYLGRLKSGELAPAESLDLARAAAAKAPLLTIADATQAYASRGWIIQQALRCKGEAPYVLVIVDSLHSWAEADPTATTEYETLNAGILALRSIAGAVNAPVLAVAERNRASMKEGGLSAGAGTRKIEYGAETVIDLERPKGASAEPDMQGEVEISVKLSKNRHGSPGKSFSLLFHGALQRFREG